MESSPFVCARRRHCYSCGGSYHDDQRQTNSRCAERNKCFMPLLSPVISGDLFLACIVGFPLVSVGQAASLGSVVEQGL
ncbi:unnamed protein product [Urochloa humidicola]